MKTAKRPPLRPVVVESGAHQNRVAQCVAIENGYPTRVESSALEPAAAESCALLLRIGCSSQRTRR